ncbi:MAG: hypothetical protein P4L35_19880 [Ignavibacteriaceae bacterium]|nr:hypothetical protein [Ignavibacteriaceae bacterium]
MAKDKPVNFSLNKITIEQFAFLAGPPKTDEKITITTDIRFGYEKDKKIIGAFAKFRFDSDMVPFLVIEVGCHFQISDEDWESFKNATDNTIVLPKGFAAHLFMLTIGTARGVLHAKIENTPYNNYFVPLINVSKMIESDVILS